MLFTPGPMGGAEKIVANGMKALLDSGAGIELWVIKEERVPQVAANFLNYVIDLGIPYKVFSSHRIADFELIFELRTQFKKEQIQIIHAHGFKAAFYGKLALSGTQKLVVTHHGKTGHTFKVKIYEYLELQVMKRSSAVIAVSQEMRSMLVHSGIKNAKCHVVENFMTSPLLQHQTFNQAPIKLLFAGRLSPEKGCGILIEAMDRVRSLDLHLTILGDGVERDKLQARTEELGLSQNVDFLGFKSNVNEYMVTSDALVMPSYREGQPLTLIEACCLGLPVVASNVGGIPELITQNGLLHNPGDVDGLATAIQELNQRLGELKGVADEMKVNFVIRFSAGTWARHTLEIYENVLSQV